VDLCSLLVHMSSSFKNVKFHNSAKAEGNAQFAIENLRTFLKVAVEKLEIRFQYDPDRIQPRQLVLCALDVARKAHEKYNLEPPDLIKLEMDIAREDAAQKEPKDDPASKQEEEKLEQEAMDLERAVSEFCTKNNLKAPTRLKERGFGTYQFDGNRVAPVRVLHGKYFLVKDGDKWKDLRAFIGAKSDGKQASSSNLLSFTRQGTNPEITPPSTTTTPTTTSTDNKDVKTQVNEPTVPDERLSKAYAKIKELETENAKIESKRKQQQDDYEKQVAQLNAALKAANDRKSTTVITLKSEEYQEEEEEDEEPQVQKNRSCFTWFSKEEAQNKNINRNYPKKKKTKKIEEEKQTTS